MISIGMIERIRYRHPVFSTGTLATQERQQKSMEKIDHFSAGASGVWFHEDGLGGLTVAKCFGKEL